MWMSAVPVGCVRGRARVRAGAGGGARHKCEPLTPVPGSPAVIRAETGPLTRSSINKRWSSPLVALVASGAYGFFRLLRALSRLASPPTARAVLDAVPVGALVPGPRTPSGPGWRASARCHLIPPPPSFPSPRFPRRRPPAPFLPASRSPWPRWCAPRLRCPAFRPG